MKRDIQSRIEICELKDLSVGDIYVDLTEGHCNCMYLIEKIEGIWVSSLLYKNCGCNWNKGIKDGAGLDRVNVHGRFSSNGFEVRKINIKED